MGWAVSLLGLRPSMSLDVGFPFISCGFLSAEKIFLSAGKCFLSASAEMISLLWEDLCEDERRFFYDIFSNSHCGRGVVAGSKW